MFGISSSHGSAGCNYKMCWFDIVAYFFLIAHQRERFTSSSFHNKARVQETKMYKINCLYRDNKIPMPTYERWSYQVQR